MICVDANVGALESGPLKRCQLCGTPGSLLVKVTVTSAPAVAVSVVVSNVRGGVAGLLMSNWICVACGGGAGRLVGAAVGAASGVGCGVGAAGWVVGATVGMAGAVG